LIKKQFATRGSQQGGGRSAEPQAFFSLEEAASKTQRSHWTLRRDIARRVLAHVRFGGPRGKIYIRAEDLDAYIRRHRVSAFGERLNQEGNI